MKNKNNVLALVALVFVFPGVLNAFSQEKDGIKINVKDFMNDTYAQVMSNTNWTITAEDLQKHNVAPITVKVTNNTDKPICISGRSVKLLQAMPEDVAAKFKKREILPPFLLSCVNGIIGIGFFGRMLWQEGNNAFNEGQAVAKKWKLDPRENDFLQDNRYDVLLGHADILLNKYGVDRHNLDFNDQSFQQINDLFKREDFKRDVDVLFANNEFQQDWTNFTTNMGDEFEQDTIGMLENAFNVVKNRSLKIIGFFTLTGLASTFGYWYYSRNLNNQLVTLFQQSILDELTTIAPNQSVEKVILCEGMLSKDFKFNIFNRGHVSIAEFAVDLNA